MSVVLSIDQSFTNTAWCLFSDGKLKKFGVIYTDKNEVIYERAKHVADKLVEVAKANDVDRVVIEQLSFGSVGSSTRNLAGLLFAIIILLVDNIPKLGYSNIKLVSPKQAKKFFTGNGNAKKAEMLDKVPEKVRQAWERAGYKKTTGLYDLADSYSFYQWLKNSD